MATIRFAQGEQSPEVYQAPSNQRGAGRRLVFRPLPIGMGRVAV